MSGSRLLPMFGNAGSGSGCGPGGGYGRYNKEGNGSPMKMMGGGGFREMYNWVNSFAPPPPPPARVNCGELRRMDTGKVVEIAGRVHKISRDRFIQLKDSHGVTQLVVPTERTDLQRRFQRMPLMSYAAVLGEVHARPVSGQNEKMETGLIEVVVEEIMMVRVHKSDGKPRLPLPSTLREPSTDDNPPKVTSEEYHKFHGLLPQLNERKLTCGDLPFKVNETVQLLCWVEKSSKKFITLMDGYGKIQCVVPTKRDDIVAIADHLSANSVVVVTGKVTERPKSQINYTSVNGHIELQVETLDWPMFDMEKIAQSEEAINCDVKMSTMNGPTARTHTCGELRSAHVGQRVVLCGWLQFNRLDKFVMIRDAYGTTQCVLSDTSLKVDKMTMPLESVLKVEGVVAMRPPSMVKEDISTGEIEVIIKDLVVLNPATNPPFIPKINEKQDEATRLQYRYMDLRSRNMQNNLRLRSRMLQNMRNFLVDKHHFIEVDTPTLVANAFTETDSVKVNADKAGVEYLLVQCPQLYTHYLMVGQIDRCFQISKTYTPLLVEGQMELSRLHVAMSFTNQDNLLYLLEQLLHDTFPKSVAAPPFTKLTYMDALRTYGSHQPDLSYDLKFHNVTTVIDNVTNVEYFGAYAIIYPKKMGNFTYKMSNLLNMLKKKYLKAQVTANLGKHPSPLIESVRKHMNVDQSKSLIVAFGDNDEACLSLGEVRRQLAEDLSVLQLLNKTKTGVKPVWVVQPPMFTASPTPGPHSFSAVHPGDELLLDTQPHKVRAIAYTLVMNGTSLGTGSVCNNDPRLLQKQIEFTKLEEGVACNFLQALHSGCPPYATISLDVDRLAALACCAESIRDVIAFPKSESGQDLLFPEPTFKRKLENEPSEPSAKMLKLT